MLKRMMHRAFGTLAILAPVAGFAQSAGDAYKTGRAAFDAANYGAAIKAFERTVQLDDRNADYHLWLARSIGMSASEASILRQPSLAKRAKSEFERTVELDPASIAGREGLLQFYLRAPGFFGGSIAKATAEADEIARVSALRGHLARATIANHQKEGAVVEREYRAAVADSPDSAAAYSALINTLNQNGKTDEAFVIAERTLARRPTDVGAQFAFVRLVAASGKHLDRGASLARQLIASPPWTADPALPTPAAVQFRLGEILQKQGDKDAARKAFETALQLNPKYDAARRALKSL
jgi:tetratricopeptide (TPR) repeat protein